MRLNFAAGLIMGAALLGASAPSVLADPPPQISPQVMAMIQHGEALFAERCATCHGVPGSKAPPRAVLSQLSVEDLAKVMMFGPMAPMAQGLGVNDVGAIAVAVSRAPRRVEPDAKANLCTGKVAALDLKGAAWNGWGNASSNARFQKNPGFAAGDVGKLSLKWAFAYTGGLVYGQPTVVGGRVFVTSQTGRIQALDAKTGCTIWTYENGAPSRTAISIGPAAAAKAAAKGKETKSKDAKVATAAPHALAYFGDDAAYVTALDADTGAVVWKVKADDHKAAIITGAPVLNAGRLYVPVSSTEEAGAQGDYECCTFRGNLVALDALTGKQIWKTYAITEEPKPYGKNKSGGVLRGPAGASIWSSPTIDAKLGRIYATTGNSYSGKEADATNAVVAFDLKTGKRLWVNQVLPADNFVIGCFVVKPPVCNYGICNGPGEGNCAEKVGPDHDFGSSSILAVLPNGKRVLMAGQKSAWVYGLDPDHNGKLLWKQKVGVGSAAGGVEWGMAADATTVYAPTSDIYVVPDDKAGGLTALDIATGKVLWQAKPNPVCAWGKQGCTGAQSQAVTALPGLVLSGAIDGHLRAYDSKTGKVVWDFDAGGTFKTVNQGDQPGGSFNHGGATVAGGMVFVNAGYGKFAGRNGHVLLAFGAP